jgi:MFS family permease
MRIVAGWWADRIGPVRVFLMIPALMVIGGVGIGLLAVGGSFLVVTAGLVVGLGFGWGWNGLLAYGLVRPNPRAAATAASFMMIGGFSGSALGPIVSGALVSGPGFGAAWTVTALAMVGAAVMTTLAGRDHRLGEVA